MPSPSMRYDAKGEMALITELHDPQIADDLAQFVLFAFPWGQSNTPLANHKGPRAWQRDYLNEVTDHLKAQKQKMDMGLDPAMWRKATASGRGIGKSALVSWLTLWMMTTRIGSTTIITANTEPQLKSRTFAEIKKWATLLINAHWFETTVLSIVPAPWFKESVERDLKIATGYYYAQGQLWSEENPDAFAGVHNPLGVRVIMDEGSGIPNKIFDVTEGFFTEPELNRFWDVFSNPRNNSGAFYNAFHQFQKFWRTRQIDSRTVEGTDKALFDRMIEQYGVDSDTVRVEVLGQFPKAGAKQFISNDAAHGAQTRELFTDDGAPLIMGVDPARFGDDEFVVRFRKGRDARSIPPVKWKGLDTVQAADKVASLIDKFDPDGICIDSGAGGGIIDILKHRKYRVHEVHFGGKAEDRQWANKATEMYAEIRDWLPGGCIDNCPLLFGDLTARDYDYFGKGKDQQILEPKEIFKGKMGRSPGDGDALALTFAKKFARRDARAGRHSSRGRVAAGLDYSPI